MAFITAFIRILTFSARESSLEVRIWRKTIYM